MASETKIGFALILVLVVAFGLVVYQKQAKQQELIAQLSGEERSNAESKQNAPAKLTSNIEDENNPVEITADPFAEEKEIAQNSQGGREPQALPTSFRDEQSAPAQLMPIEKSNQKKQDVDPFAEPETPDQEIASNKKSEKSPAQLDGQLGLPEETLAKNNPASPFETEKNLPKETTTQQLPEQTPFDNSFSSNKEDEPPKNAFDEPVKKEEGVNSSPFDKPLPPETTPTKTTPVATTENDPFSKPEEPVPPKEKSPFNDSPEDKNQTKVADLPPLKKDAPFGSSDTQPDNVKPLETKPTEAQPFKREPVEAKPVGNRADKIYVVEQNDNYWNISKVVYGQGGYFRALARYNLNRIRNPKRLKPGMKVLVPTVERLKKRFPKDCPRTVSAITAEGKAIVESGFRLSETGEPTYIIGSGDTLGSIARGHLGRASRWVQIYQMNREAVKNPKKLKIGTVLQLPADASRVRLVH